MHSPLEAPQASLDLYPELNGSVKTRAAMVSSMDENMGKIVDALRATGQLANTVIVYGFLPSLYLLSTPSPFPTLVCVLLC